MGKREALRSSDTLLMTRAPREVPDWGEDQIDARTSILIDALLSTWPAPEGHSPEPVRRAEQSQSSSVTLRGLVAAGVLSPGTRLTGIAGNGEERYAVVTTQGALEVNGVTYAYPSGAGKAVCGFSVNGWYFWRLPDGSRLMSLRDGHDRVSALSPMDRLPLLMARPESERFVRLLGGYLRAMLPERLDQGGQVWSLSLLPSTNRTASSRRVITLSVANLEIAYVLEVDPEAWEEGMEGVGEVPEDPYAANLLFTGDSLDVLRILCEVPEYRAVYRGKVKLVYVDPPFNTGQAFEHYDDWMEHSTWLSFMRERLLRGWARSTVRLRFTRPGPTCWPPSRCARRLARGRA